MAISGKPSNAKLWVLPRLKSPPSMYRLLERRWDVEVIFKKRSYMAMGDIQGMYTFVMIMYLNLDEQCDIQQNNF